MHLEGEMLHTSTVRILYIDLASHHGLLACIEEDRVVASEHVDHRIGDHELIPLFERLLGVAGWKPADLTQIACVTGPGGFMSLRVAVAFANTLIHQLRIPGAGVQLSDVYAARCNSSPRFSSFHATSIPRPLPPAEEGEIAFRNSYNNKNTHSPSLLERGLGGEVNVTQDALWLHSTKKHELFVRGSGKFHALWPEATHCTVVDFLARVHSGAQWTGELIPEHEALIREKGMAPVTLRPIEEILPKFLASQTFTAKLLEPWYGRNG